MVDDRVRDGRRLAELLASELHGRDAGPLGRLAVTDADREVEPTEAGAFAYAVALNDARVATVHVHPDRLHLAVERGVDAAVEAAGEAGLRARPKAVDPPQTLVFVEDGAEVKRATDVLAAVVAALDREGSA
jgi:hypothetical protein